MTTKHSNQGTHNMKRYASMIAIMAAMTAPAMATTPQTVRFCTGASGGNYEFSGIEVARQMSGAPTKVVIVNTKGSLDNLARLDSADADGCDVAIVQSDALNVYMRGNPKSSLSIERGRAMYKEYVHLICNPSAGLSKITGLTTKTVLLTGANGGGAAVTWESFTLADKKRYGGVPTRPVGGLRAASMVQEGTEAACLFQVIGLKAPAMNEINQLAATSNDRLRLVPADDSDLPGVKDPKGKPMYTAEDIPGGTYPGMQHGTFSTSVATISVDALFVAKTSWIDDHEADYQNLLRGVNRAMPAIRQRVGQ